MLHCRHFSLRDLVLAVVSMLVLGVLLTLGTPSLALADGTLYSHWDASSGVLSFYSAAAPSSQEDSVVTDLKAAIDPHRSDAVTIDFSKAGNLALSGDQTSGLFKDCRNLKNIVSLGNLDTTQATNMDSMFNNCNSLEAVDAAGLETHNVVYMQGMFSECHSLKAIDLSSWDTSSLQRIYSCFVNCRSLTSVKLPAMGGPNSKLNSVGHLFWGCTSLKEGDISSIDTRTITDSWSWSAISGIFGDHYMGWGEDMESYDSGLYKIVTGPNFVQNPGVDKWCIFPKTMYRIDDGSYARHTYSDYIPNGSAVYVVRAALSFDGNGATSGSMDDTLLYYYSEGASQLPKNAFKRDGYTFLGWSSDPNATSATVSDQESLDFDAVTQKAQRRDSDDQGEEFSYTLYAIWAKNPTIAFDPNGGTGSMSSVAIGYGASYSLPVCTFTRSGYHFSGWNTAKDGSGTAYSDASLVSLTADLTLYAQWTANPAISFNSNGGVGSMDPVVVAPSESTTLPKCEFGRRGYTFSGWNTAKDGSGTAYSDESKISITDDLTLYAQWREQTYTITYDPAGGTWADGTAGTVAKAYGKASDPAKILDAPTREGYKFVRWEGSSYQPGDAYDKRGEDGLLTDDTLTAVWEEAPAPSGDNPGGKPGAGTTVPATGASDELPARPGATAKAAPKVPETGDSGLGGIAAALAALGAAALAGVAGIRLSPDRR